MKSAILLLCPFLLLETATAQLPEEFSRKLLPVPLQYTVYKATEPIVLDGKDDEDSWKKAAWSEAFSDIEGSGGTRFPYTTRCKMLWDADHLYIYVKMETRTLWAVHKTNDVVFRENVLKFFIDPDNNMHATFEIQINPFNETYYLMLNKPYRDRGILVTGWVPAGAQSAVSTIGTINDPSDEDKEWNVEIAFPFKGINAGAKPPQEGSMWRFDIQRTDYDLSVKDGVYSKAVDAQGKALPQQNTAWSPPMMSDIPFPERWGHIWFTQAPAGSRTSFTLPYSEEQRRYLWSAYYLQKEWVRKNGRYAATLKELNVPENVVILGKSNILTQEATSRQFIISIKEGTGRAISINQEGLIGN